MFFEGGGIAIFKVLVRYRNMLYAKDTLYHDSEETVVGVVRALTARVARRKAVSHMCNLAHKDADGKEARKIAILSVKASKVDVRQDANIFVNFFVL